jgi:hypothetical protein
LRPSRVEILEGDRLGKLVFVVLLRELELVVFGVFGDVLAINFLDFGEQEPVIAVTRGRDDHVIAVLEESIDLVRRCR